MSGQHEQDAPSGVAVIEPGLLARFAERAGVIPLEDGSHGAERILDQILSAQRWDELDAPWESTQADQLAGRRLRLDRAERRPSQFRDGLGVFLVLHCTDTATGEPVVVTSSSISVVGQVVQAYWLQALPLIIEFVVADRLTEAGYRPHHLKVLGSGASRQQAGDRESAK